MKNFLFLIFFPTLIFSSVAKSSEEICSKYSNTIWEGKKKVFDDYEKFLLVRIIKLNMIGKARTNILKIGKQAL